MSILLNTQFQKNYEHDKDVDKVECPDKRDDDGFFGRWVTRAFIHHHDRCQIFHAAPVK